jgi:hypothetical protein
MPRGVATDKQLALMANVLDAYCGEHGITELESREELGAVILSLFDRGERTENALTEALLEYVRRYGMFPAGPTESA